MRIVHLPNLYAPSVGGVQRQAAMLSEGLAARGDEVSVFTSDAIDASGFYDGDVRRRVPTRRELLRGVGVRRFPIRDRLHTLLFASLPSALGTVTPRARHALEAGAWHRALRVRPFCPGLSAALVRARPDLNVAFNAASPFAAWCRLAKAIAGVPYVVVPTLHTTAAWAHDPRVTWALEGADAVIAATGFERDHLVGRGIDPGRVAVVPLGIEPAAGPARSRSEAKRRLGLSPGPVVGLVGRQDAGKGTRTLVAAMRRVFARRPEAQLLLTGRCEPSFEASLGAALARLQPAERARVAVLGEFPEDAARDVYAACDVFAMPSTVESFGLAYLEAWRERVPVIAAAGGAPASFLRDGVDAVLVPPGDDGALADAIERLLDDPGRARALGRAGHARLAEELSADRMVARVRRVYTDVVGRGDERAAQTAAVAAAEPRP